MHPGKRSSGPRKRKPTCRINGARSPSKDCPRLSVDRRNAIIVRAQRLGCGAHLAGDTRISLNQLMLAIYGKNMLGYTSDRLIRYGLPVKWHVVKKNRFRVIDIDAFWKWAEDNKSILDFSRFEKYGLGAEPDWVDVKRKADYKKLQLHGQHNAAWTKTEDDKLRYLLSKGTYTYSDLAAELRHSEGAIKRRILDLGINKKPVRCPPENGRRTRWKPCAAW